MLGKTLPIAVCCLAFVIGCEKKEPEAGAPSGRSRGVEAPPGMVLLSEQPPVFMTAEPVSVAQYVQYLKATGQGVPEPLRPAALGGPGGEQPITGLTRKQAARYATYDLKRLPRQEEWGAAAPYVAPEPYPWAGLDENTPVVAPVYLVQDWLPGSEGERQAIAARQDLMAELEAERAAGFAQARQHLADIVQARKSAAAQRWQSFKPAFFSLVEKQKELAELRARAKGREDVLKILNRIVAAKGRLAATLKTSDQAPQAAIKAYEDQLAQWRSEVQATRQTLEDHTRENQQEVLKLTDQFDQLGPKEIAERFAEAEALLQQSAEKPTDPRDAAALQSQLVTAAQTLEDSPPLFESLPDAAALSDQTGEAQQAIANLPADEETVDQIAAAKDHLQGFGESIGQDFLDEKLLVQDLDTLVDLRARREAVMANLAALRGLMRQIAAPEAVAE